MHHLAVYIFIAQPRDSPGKDLGSLDSGWRHLSVLEVALAIGAVCLPRCVIFCLFLGLSTLPWSYTSCSYKSSSSYQFLTWPFARARLVVPRPGRFLDLVFGEVIHLFVRINKEFCCWTQEVKWHGLVGSVPCRHCLGEKAVLSSGSACLTN